MEMRNLCKAMKTTMRESLSVAFATLAVFSTTTLFDPHPAGAQASGDADTFAVIVRRPTSSAGNDPKVRAIVERVGQVGFEKLFKAVTRQLAKKLKFYRDGETPAEPIARRYQLEFLITVQGEDNWAAGDDDWVEGIMITWTLSRVSPYEKLVMGQKQTRFIGNIRSLRYPTVEEELRRLLSEPVSDVIPTGPKLKMEIIRDRPTTPPPPPPPAKRLTARTPVDFNFEFEFDSHKLRPSSKGELANLEKAVKSYFFGNRTGIIQIVGHASLDPVSNPERDKKLRRQRFRNSILSKLRAKEIETKLRNSGVVGDLRTDGRGDTQPKPGNTNKDENERRQNRRVEVTAN